MFESRLRPLFPYYGSKWRLAPQYPEPRYSTVVEPFAGSACYALNWWWFDVELYDIEPMASLWRYLIKSTESEILSLPLIDIDDSADNIPGVCPEARHLIGLWCHRGIPRPARRSSTWRRSGLYDGHFWSERTRARVARQLKYIEHWRVLGSDYRQARNLESTWFIDPPYEGHKGLRYSGLRLDYGSISIWARARIGQVIACESEGARWLPFIKFRETRGISSSRYTEVIYSR